MFVALTGHKGYATHIISVESKAGNVRRLPFHCHKGFFVCSTNSQCIAPQFVCDGQRDCPTGQDEDNCVCSKSDKRQSIPSSNCWAKFTSTTKQVKIQTIENVELQCSSFGNQNFWLHEICLFILSEKSLPYFCDFGSHLKNCTSIHCTNNFKCPHSYCIPHHYICRWDCPFGEDEAANCSAVVCPGYFHCRGQSTCLHPVYICDGAVDCSFQYEDDEIMCVEAFICPHLCTCLGFSLACSGKEMRSIDFMIPQYVTLLSLSDNELTLFPPLLLKGLIDVKFINLSHNNFTHISKSFIHTDMFDLEQLDLSHNKIRVLPEKLFANLRSARLHNLILIFNVIEEVQNWAFACLTYLKVLDLSGMFIKHLFPYSFANITNLKYLSLSKNMISSLCFDTFQNTESLLLLDIIHNPLKSAAGFLEGILSSMKLLQISQMEFCCMSSAPGLLCGGKTHENTTGCSHASQSISHAMRILSVVAAFLCLAVIIYLLSVESIKQKMHLSFLTVPSLLNCLAMFLHDIIDLEHGGNCASVSFISNLCHSVFLASFYLFHMSFTLVAVLAIDSFLLVIFPFRRKGFTLNQLTKVTSVAHIPFIGILFADQLSSAFPFYYFKMKPYEECIKHKTIILHFQIVNTSMVWLSAAIVLILKLITAIKLLTKSAELEKENKLKRRVGHYTIMHIISCFMFWVPVSIILLLPCQSKQETYLSVLLHILQTLSSITNMIIYIFIKQDFRAFMIGFGTKLASILCVNA